MTGGCFKTATVVSASGTLISGMSAEQLEDGIWRQKHTTTIAILKHSVR